MAALQSLPTLENMRIDRNVPPVTLENKQVAFRDWVLNLGNGTEKSLLLDGDSEPTWIRIPDEVYYEYFL